MCVHSLISCVYMWLLHFSLHKAIQGLGNPVCKASMSQQGQSALHNIPMAAGTEPQASHAGSGPSSLCFPFQQRNAAQMFPSEPNTGQGSRADGGRQLASLSGTECGLWGRFQNKYPLGPIPLPFPRSPFQLTLSASFLS